MEYASNGKANAALTTGIIGTAGVGLGAVAKLAECLGNRAPAANAADVLAAVAPAMVAAMTAKQAPTFRLR